MLQIAALTAAVLLACTEAAQYYPQTADYSFVSLIDGSRPEGVTAGSNNDLWVACLSGRILHVDLSTNTTTVVHHEHGTVLSGAKYDPAQRILFTAGSLSGKGYIFHMQSTDSSGSSGQQYTLARKEVVDLHDRAGFAYINDVALAPDAVYFTDSFHPIIYSISRVHKGNDSRPVHRHHTGQHFNTRLGQFRANGLAVVSTTNSSDTLLVANTHTGNLYRVSIAKDAEEQSALNPGQQSQNPSQPEKGPGNVVLSLPGLTVAAHTPAAPARQQAEVTELELPRVPGKTADYLLLDGVWMINSTFALVADNYNNRVWGIQLEDGMRTATLSCLIQVPVFGVPTTITAVNGKVWITNAHLDSCFPFLPCPHHKFEVIGVDVDTSCQPWAQA